MNENEDFSADHLSDIDGDDEGQLEVVSGQRKATMEPKDFTLANYHRLHQKGRLNLNPDWQRDYVWGGKRPSLLIESLFMKIPIPVIFLAETAQGYEVIDGVQRLTTIINFFENKFPLQGLEVFKELNGKRFADLPANDQESLEFSTISCFILSENTPQDLKFLTFERINTGGMKLNEMEVRNCIFRGPLNDKIAEMARFDDFRTSVNMKNLSNRMLDRNLILRFLAFDELNHEKATSGLKSFLNRFCEIYQNSSRILPEFERRFKLAMANCVTVFGANAFRIRRIDSRGGGEWAPRPNASIFQVVATSLAQYDRQQVTSHCDAIFEEYLDILQDQYWIDAVTKATGDARNIRYSFETWHSRMSKLMDETVGLDSRRIFTQQHKKDLFENNSSCAICGNEIKLLNDAAVDHIKQYWRGGETIPSNARLVHRSCNASRPRDD